MANIFRIQAVWSGVAGAPFYTTFYFTSDGLTAGAEAAQADVSTFLNANEPLVTQSLRWDLPPVVEEINDATGDLVGAYSVPADFGFGTNTAEGLPPSTCGLIKWSTGVVVAGRFLKGRTYFPLPGENMNDASGNPSTVYINGLRIPAQALIDSPNSQLRIWSRTHGTSSPATVASVWSKWASLRSHRD